MTPDVEIEYCVPCGHLERAIDTQRVILEKLGQKIEGVKLKTGDGGVFTIRVNDEQIYDRTQSFDLAQIVGLIEARI